jgi:MFS family permease
MIEGVLVGVFAIVGGFLSDVIGRKRIAIFGFIMLGIGYATLGIYPGNLLSWYFYTLVDGIAWGTFSVIFIITIWGDLSYDSSSNKYYAIGGLPYFISNFLRLTVGSYISKTVSAYAIFSLTAFFLFLAVFPLMYAPETLPEKKIREREVREYIEKAKKIKEKHV